MQHPTIIPKQLYENRNSSNIFDREVLSGILRILNRKLSYDQIWDEIDNKVEIITVPFFYDFGGGNPNSEKWIQDHYLFFGEDGCSEIGLKKFDGSFDSYPRGIVSMSSVNIDTQSMTNRFVLARYQKKIDGQLKSYVSYIYSIPLQYSFKLSIKCKTMTESMKIDQAYREYFYKNRTFHINYKGLVVPCRIGFPETLSRDSMQSYTMGGTDQKQYIDQSFDITVETYQPVFDPTTEREADTSINGFGLGIGIEGHNAREGERLLIPINDLSNSTLIAGTDIMLEWFYSFQFADMLNVEISYIDKNTNTEYLIDRCPNTNFYIWSIPEDLQSLIPIDIIIPNTNEVQVFTAPNIKLVPDLKTKIIKPENTKIINKGYFITNQNQVDGFINYEYKGKIIEIPIKINLLNNMININNPIEFKPFVYRNKINPIKIDLIIKDSYHYSTMLKMENISII